MHVNKYFHHVDILADSVALNQGMHNGKKGKLWTVSLQIYKMLLKINELDDIT